MENSVINDEVIGILEAYCALNAKLSAACKKLDESIKAHEERVQTMENEFKNLKFKEIRQVLNTFTADDNYKIINWIKELESIADRFKWCEFKRYFIGIRLVGGSARLYLRDQPKPITTWSGLKAILIFQYYDEKTSNDVVKELKMRKKHYYETYLQYFNDMVRIADVGFIDDDIIIYYIISGIDHLDSIYLNNINTLTELRKKMISFEDSLDFCPFEPRRILPMI